MDEKISLEAIALYGDSYADKVLKGFFSGKATITGPEILTLSPIQQVNLFVISELFKAWKDETQKQKSAYFDYSHPEVKDALNTFMSVLSNHIAIDQSHFAPLFRKAVSQTLLVIFDPYDFFSLLVAGKTNKLELVSFREEIKYLRINKAPLEKMLARLEEKKITEIPGNEAFAVLDQVLEEVNFTPEDLDPYISKFSSVVPLDPASFYVKGQDAPQPVIHENKVTRQEQTNTVVQENRVTTHENKIVVEQKRVVIQENKVTEPTINERMNKVKQPAVLDNLRKISKIRDILSINQKFMFTKVLFYGDFESFSRAIDELDQLSDMNEALNYLEQHSSAWDRDSKEFHEFMELVEKRFN
jgi:hypothetical protein